MCASREELPFVVTRALYLNALCADNGVSVFLWRTQELLHVDSEANILHYNVASQCVSMFVSKGLCAPVSVCLLTLVSLLSLSMFVWVYVKDGKVVERNMPSYTV